MKCVFQADIALFEISYLLKGTLSHNVFIECTTFIPSCSDCSLDVCEERIEGVENTVSLSCHLVAFRVRI